MSANSHNFPEMFRASLDPQGMDIADCYDVGEVLYWFKRCMEDYPDLLDRPTQTLIARQKWYIRWFSQFRNKEIKNETESNMEKG